MGRWVARRRRSAARSTLPVAAMSMLGHFTNSGDGDAEPTTSGHAAFPTDGLLGILASMLLPQGLVLTHAATGTHADRDAAGASSATAGGFPTMLSAPASHHQQPHGSSSGFAGRSLQLGHHQGHAVATHPHPHPNSGTEPQQQTRRERRQRRHAAIDTSQSTTAADSRDASGLKLIAIGSRQWGNWWDGRGLLKVRIYDFAVYVDPAQARKALGQGQGWRRGARARKQQQLGMADQLKAHPGVPMSLTIRAARNLPLPMLSDEFERILQRRHEKVGGASDDPALREVLSYFSRERLPSAVVQGDAVRKGASITFSRSPGGELITQAGGAMVGRVVSPKVCEALFDLYLGEQPVSKRAKAAAGDALVRLLQEQQQHYQYKLQAGERLLCSGDGPSGCVVELL